MHMCSHLVIHNNNNNNTLFQIKSTILFSILNSFHHDAQWLEKKLRTKIKSDRVLYRREPCICQTIRMLKMYNTMANIVSVTARFTFCIETSIGIQ